MGKGGTPARETSFVSLVAYGPNSDSALTVRGTASETRQGSSQHTAKKGQGLDLWVSQGICNQELSLSLPMAQVKRQCRAVGKGLALDHIKVKDSGLRVC